MCIVYGGGGGGGGEEGATFGTWTMQLASTARVDQLVSEHLR